MRIEILVSSTSFHWAFAARVCLSQEAFEFSSLNCFFLYYIFLTRGSSGNSSAKALARCTVAIATAAKWLCTYTTAPRRHFKSSGPLQTNAEFNRKNKATTSR